MTKDKIRVTYEYTGMFDLGDFGLEAFVERLNGDDSTFNVWELNFKEALVNVEKVEK